MAAPSTTRFGRSRIDDESVRRAKHALRAQKTAARTARPDDGGAAAHLVRDRFIEAFAAARPKAAVSAYWPMGDELDPCPLLNALFDRGWVCALPVVEARGMPLTFRRWQPGDVLAAAHFGLSEPGPEAPIVAPDIVIAPMLAADPAGRRLGYGGGYYDRTIKTLRATRAIIVVAIGYDLQICPAVPTTANDEPVDWVISENRALRCAANL